METWRRGDYELVTDPGAVDVALVHRFLAEASYWARGVPREAVEEACRHSLCFTLRREGGQVGFARVVSDFVRFAWLADVFVVPAHRGRGLGAWMVARVLAHPRVAAIPRVVLATADAHGLYARFGFEPAPPSGLMQRRLPAPWEVPAARG
jgi:GNAT superfamily N-acetyltransferase